MAAYTGLLQPRRALGGARRAELASSASRCQQMDARDECDARGLLRARRDIGIAAPPSRSSGRVPSDRGRRPHAAGLRARLPRFYGAPDCDAVYIGGGSWIAEPVAARLEAEFGKPVLCNQRR